VYTVVSNITSKLKARTAITLIFYFHFPFNELLTYSIFLQAKEYEGAATSAKNSYPYWDVKQYVQRKSCPNHCKRILKSHVIISFFPYDFSTTIQPVCFNSLKATNKNKTETYTCLIKTAVNNSQGHR